jgi:hypothetical protein
MGMKCGICQYFTDDPPGFPAGPLVFFTDDVHQESGLYRHSVGSFIHGSTRIFVWQVLPVE